jgi:hypothetical protein
MAWSKYWGSLSHEDAVDSEPGFDKNFFSS